jgi:hypothetical protein
MHLQYINLLLTKHGIIAKALKKESFAFQSGWINFAGYVAVKTKEILKRHQGVTNSNYLMI